MAVIAAVAVAVTAISAASAVGGYRLGGATVGVVPYTALVVAGVGLVVAGRQPREVPFPERWRGVAGAGLLFAALFVFSGDGGLSGDGGPFDAWLAGVPAVAGLLVPVTALLWPQTRALRAAVALSAVGLLTPGASPTEAPALLALMAVGAAVALVATNRRSAASAPALGGASAPAHPAGLGRETAPVVFALAVAALLSTVVDAPPRRAPPTTGTEPERQEPAPLAFADQLDAGARGRGASGDPDEIVLRVGAPRPDVWRALTYDRWDGRRWRRSVGSGSASVTRGARFVPVPGEPFRAGVTDRSNQRVRVEVPYAAVAVGAPQVEYFVVPAGAEVGPDGSVRLVPPVGRGATYEVFSMRVVATGAELRAAGAAVPSRDPGSYLDASGVSERARTLATRITAGAPTAYDRVRAVERWLDANVEVDDDAPALAEDADPVDAVLFGPGAAPPERLATTLAVLARALGVPARLATGFLPGERPLFGGAFVVRARHAHAWVEVPFTGLGWQRFDPTGRIAVAEDADSFLARLGRFLARWWPVLAAVAVLALAVVVHRLVVRRRRRRALPWATRYFARLARVGADRGRPRRPAETPVEYAAALADGVLADERLHRVGELVTAAAWSGREPPEDARRWAEDVLESAAARPRARRRSRS